MATMRWTTGVLAGAAALALAGCTAGVEDDEPARATSAAPGASVATPTPTASALEFPDAPAEDQALVAALVAFAPEPELLTSHSLVFEGTAAAPDGVMPTSEWSVIEHTLVDPATCGPVVNLLTMATDDDTTTRADDPIVHLGYFYVDEAGEPGPGESALRARVLDDPEAASRMVDLPETAETCTAFSESGSIGVANVEDVRIARLDLDGVAAPVTRLDVHIVDLVDESAGTVDVIDRLETTYYLAVDRVMVRFQVDAEHRQDELAAAVLAQLGALIAQADA